MGIVSIEKFAISVGEDEEAIELTADYLTSVVSVTVIPPPDRSNERFCIYGDVSVTDDLSKPAVTIFSRSKDDSQIISLKNAHLRCLVLTDHPSDRPLDGESRCYVTMKLYEDKNVKLVVEGEDSEEEDPDPSSEMEEDEDEDEDEDDVIACIKDTCVKNVFTGHYDFDMPPSFELPGNYGFKFGVRHAIVYGNRVQVEVKFNRDIELTEQQVLRPSCSTKKRGKHTVRAVYGRVEAIQDLGFHLQKPRLRMCTISRYHPIPVRVGKRIPLDRSIVAAAVGDGILSIAITLWSSDCHTLVADELVRFGIVPVQGSLDMFLTNKRRTHTKLSSDGLFSVSITFVDRLGNIGYPCFIYHVPIPNCLAMISSP